MVPALLTTLVVVAVCRLETYLEAQNDVSL